MSDTWLPISAAPMDGTKVEIKRGAFETVGFYEDGMWKDMYSPVRMCLPLGPHHQPTHWRTWDGVMPEQARARQQAAFGSNPKQVGANSFRLR